MVSIPQVVPISGAKCELGHQLSAAEFSGGKSSNYPIRVSTELARNRLIHPHCGATVHLEVEAGYEATGATIIALAQVDIDFFHD